MILYNFSEISSTNDYAKELLSDEDIICVTAQNQINGRGRNNNVWYGDFGNNLYISFGIKHQNSCTLEFLANLQSIGAIAVKQSLEQISNISYRLKYPNDVYAYDGSKYRKISGVLVEHGFLGSECNYSIIGIGVNINEINFPKEIKETAVSLKQLGISVKIDELQSLVINHFSLLLSLEDSEVYNLWVKELNIIGKEITLVKGLHYYPNDMNIYTAYELLNDGRLVLSNQENSKIIIDNGDTIRYNFD